MYGYANCQGILKLHKIVITVFNSLTPVKTFIVDIIIVINIVIKNIKKLYLNQGDDKNFGGTLFLESFNLLSKSSKSSPLPQNLLQKSFPPPKIEIKIGIQNSISPNQAKGYYEFDIDSIKIFKPIKKDVHSTEELMEKVREIIRKKSY